jgi:predicted nucleic acid-binding protein
VIVADANLIVYLFVEGERTEAARAVLAKAPTWIAPPLWRSELLNVLNGYVKRGAFPLRHGVNLFTAAEDIVSSGSWRSEAEQVLALSQGSGCTTYDCEYVALAQKLEVPLVTADKQVLRAFPAVAVSIESYAATPVSAPAASWPA